jgi:murein DD-endopeptidase MepM/ murein hydrolase activator NlpD
MNVYWCVGKRSKKLSVLTFPIRPGNFLLILCLMIFLISFPLQEKGYAQEDTLEGPFYIVQEYDTIWDIARRFRILPEQLIAANQLTNPGQIQVGNRLIIPGLEGVSGSLITVPIHYGETVKSIGRRYLVSQDFLNKLNGLVSPSQAYVNFDLIIPESREVIYQSQKVSMKAGQSILELALITGINPYKLAKDNFIPVPSVSVPHDIFFLDGDGIGGPGALPAEVLSIKLDPDTLTQGKTAVIKIEITKDLLLTGSLVDKELKFLQEEANTFVALQGVHALQAPGAYPVVLIIENEGEQFIYSQMVYLRSAGYPQAPDIKVDQAGLDPAITQPEDARWLALAEPATPERYWQGNIQFPSPPIYLGQYTARFGERRTYNNEPRLFYHTGLDIPGQTGTEVYAPAPGFVVLAEHLDVRGHSLMINHGWGVYTAFMHLSDYRVSKGDWVDTGQVIALVGNTGLRTTGAHLHWEVIVGGVQVDPLEWLERDFP